MMKHNYKQIIALILLVAMVLPVMTGCKEESKASGGKSGNNVAIDNVSDFAVEGTTHIFNIADADGFLAQDGKSEYAVVISKDAGSNAQTAAKEFVNFFLEATNIYLPTVYAEEVAYNADNKYVVIGNTWLTESAGLRPDYEVLGDHGFQIQTVGNSIYVYGITELAAQYGTYELLSQLFHFEVYAANCYYIDTNVKEVALKAYDVTDVPDIGIRADNYQFLKTDITTRDRLR